ncbi:uncharacterized protein LOC109280994 isoform X2 [Alligator mississippiensis]|uniref:uncharacterized protein LOC109280994 isoform X2 n=1 Tax=Alligator mississippiensis TaxID=8496 RepID=UPI0028775CC9|nr:uncharacterized protein LOC109280994 isoform X2 [Alligator mississippiensis]
MRQVVTTKHWHPGAQVCEPCLAPVLRLPPSLNPGEMGNSLSRGVHCPSSSFLPQREKHHGRQRCQQLELKALWAWLAQAEQDIEVILSCARQREERLRAQVEALRSQNLLLVLALKAQREQDQDQDDSPTETPMDMEGIAEECWPPWRGTINPYQEMETVSHEDKRTQTNLPLHAEASTQAEGPGHEHTSTQTRALCLSKMGCQTEPLPVTNANTQRLANANNDQDTGRVTTQVHLGADYDSKILFFCCAA